MSNFVFALPSAVCAGAAAYLAYHDKPGWGWFLFAAFILFPRIYSTGN